MSDAAADVEKALIAVLHERGVPVQMSRESFDTIDIRLLPEADVVEFSLKEKNG